MGPRGPRDGRDILHPGWVFWAELGVVVLTSGTFLVVGYLLCRRHSWARYTSIIAGAVCLGYRVLTSTFPDRFYIELPYLILSGLIAPAGFLLLAAALTLTMKKSRQRVLIGVFAVVLTYYVFCDAVYLVVKGPDISRLAGQWEERDIADWTVFAMRQSRSFTCGPAAAASLLRAWDIDVAEGRLAYAARTSFRGTEPPRLADAIRALGRERCLKVAIRTKSFEALRREDRPAILFVTVKRERRRHVVTLLKMRDGQLIIADPGRGARGLSLLQFDRDYEWQGRAIVAWRDNSISRLLLEPPQPSLSR